MQQKARHLHVARLGCPECAEKDETIAAKDEELERVRDALRTVQVELNRSMEAEAAANEVAKAAGRAAVAAKVKRTKQNRADATAEQIEAVVAHWRHHRPKTSKEFGTPGTASYDVIEKAVKLMTPEQTAQGRLEGVRACCEAITGLHMAPWEEYGKWYAKPKSNKSTLRNQVRYALGDEQKIERCRQVVRWARGDAWQALA